MSDYLTVAKAKTRFNRTVSGLYDDEGSVNDDWIQDDIDAVEGDINAALAAADYDVPVTATRAVNFLRGIAEDLLQERAYLRKPSANVPDSLQKVIDRRREQLDNIAKGELKVAGADFTATAEASESITMEGNTPEMTRPQLSGF